MNNNISIQLITLTTGGRLLRLEDPGTGLSLERKLNPEKPVVPQKAKLLQLFEAMLQSELAAA
jgi:hypothetical protein